MIRLGPDDDPPRTGRAQSVVITGVALTAGVLASALLAALLFVSGPAAAAPVAFAAAGALALALVIHRLSHARLALVVAALATLGGGGMLAWRVGWSAHAEILALALVAAALLDSAARPAFRIGFAVVVSVLAVVTVAAAGVRDHGQVGATVAAGHGALVLVITALGLWLVSLSVRRAEAAVADLRLSSRLDPVTGLLDRHAIKETLEYEAARSRRNGLPFSVMLAEIDHLEALSDGHGPGCGDWVLITTANMLRKVLRQQDHLSRWSQSRFLLLLPDTDAGGGRIAAERIRAEVQRSTYMFDGREVIFTLTLGVAAVTAGRGLATTLALIEDAVAEGAGQGGDQVVVVAPEGPSEPVAELYRDPFADDEQTFSG